MKNKLYYIILITLASCFSNNNNTLKNEDSVINSFDSSKLYKKQIKDGPIHASDTIYYSKKDTSIHSFYKPDTLTIINKSNEILDKIYLHLTFYDRYLPEISQHEDDFFLYVEINDGSVSPDYNALYDKINERWIVKNNGRNYLGSPPDKKYHLFEMGTGPGNRGFAIYNNNGDLLKSETYYSNLHGQLSWKNKNELFYYRQIEKFTDPLQEDKETGLLVGHVRKIFWIDGKDFLTQEIEKAYFQ